MIQTYASDGARLAFRDSGAGTPVIFLHPTPLDGEYWRPMLAELPRIRAIVPDFRGHGASELGPVLPVGDFHRVPDAPVLTMAQLAADVLALLDHLRLDQAFFAGCSIGGYGLLELWRRAPERMCGLAFVCSKPQPDAEAGLARRVLTIATARGEGTAKLFDGMAQNLVGTTTREQRPQVVAELRARMTLTVEAEVAVQAGLAARPDSLPTVATINAPVLSIAGAEDSAISPSDMEALRAAPGGCESHVVANAGHFAAYEQPAKLASLISAWLRRHGA
ncbi:MAG: alpha/beta fold hydrolase [Terracidiphilus sp.]